MPNQTSWKDYHTVTPYLVVADVSRLIEFLKGAFGGTERIRVPRADGSIMHAEVALGDSIVMMGEPTGQIGLMPAGIFLRVEDCDARLTAAHLAAGGHIVPFPGANRPSQRRRTLRRRQRSLRKHLVAGDSACKAPPAG